LNRSNNCIFVSHCLLAQAVVADGLAKHAPAAVKPVVQFCLDNDINIFQMPCPEVQCPSGGFGRSLRGKVWYEANGLRETSAEIAKQQADYMASLSESGMNILAILGVEFSPACAVTYLNKGRTITRATGIYIEELQQQLEAQDLSIPFIGVNQRWLKKLDTQLREIL